MSTSVLEGTPTKEIISAIVTSGLSPEETLEQLNSYGIEWYVTGQGDLMIRYWQVGAEEFVPVEQVARIRQAQVRPREADALEWLSRHLRDLRTKYAGQWIAVANNEFVAASPDLLSLLTQVRDLGVEDPFVTQIPAEPVVWTTAYAR